MNGSWNGGVNGQATGAGPDNQIVGSALPRSTTSVPRSRFVFAGAKLKEPLSWETVGLVALTPWIGRRKRAFVKFVGSPSKYGPIVPATRPSVKSSAP